MRPERSASIGSIALLADVAARRREEDRERAERSRDAVLARCCPRRRTGTAPVVTVLRRACANLIARDERRACACG